MHDIPFEQHHLQPYGAVFNLSRCQKYFDELRL